MKPKTNIEFLNDAMTFSRFGPLAQVFVMQAVEKYANAVIQAGPEAVDSPMISGEAWVGVAAELKEKFERRLNPVPRPDPERRR